MADLLERHPTAFAQWLIALDLAARPIDEVAVIGEAATPGTIALLAAVRSRFRPRLVLAAAGPAAARDSAVALLHDRTLRDERPTAYVCHGFACRAPVTTRKSLRTSSTARAVGSRVDRLGRSAADGRAIHSGSIARARP